VTETITSAFQQTSWIEALAVVLGIAYVILAAYESNWCWLAAAISVSLYIYICFNAKLYSETGLQVFYLIMAFYGWWQWKSGKPGKEKLEISVLKTSNHLLLIALGLLLTFLFYFVMKNYTNAALPLADAFVTAFSLIATFMVAKKNLENWIWWILIDGLAVYIYFRRGLQLTAFLYFIYAIIAVAGFINWKKEFTKQ